MKPIITKTKITLLSLALVFMACSKKGFTQSDLDNARREGVSSAQPSTNRLALLKAQKALSLKARQVAYTADTMQRALAKNTPKTGFYSKAEGRAEIKKWIDTTEALITSAFGEPTNKDGTKLTFGFQTDNTEDKGTGVYNKIAIGLAKINPVKKKEKAKTEKPQNVAGDSVNHVDKSVIYTVGGWEFIFVKATNAAFVLSTAGSGQEPEFAIYPVKLTWRKRVIADNLYTASAILAALQDALAQAIAATK